MIRAILRRAGIRRARLKDAFLCWFRYAKDRKEFRRMMAVQHIPWGCELPILGEWNGISGDLGAYFYQD